MQLADKLDQACWEHKKTYMCRTLGSPESPVGNLSSKSPEKQMNSVFCICSAQTQVIVRHLEIEPKKKKSPCRSSFLIVAAPVINHIH